MPTPAIRVEQLGKRYRIGRRRPHESARAAIAATFGRLVAGRRGAAVGPADDFVWALDDVSFEIAAGETVGIVGRNGAGKSTLLKILAQITDPTTGVAAVSGRVGSLLEVGTGFHADLTGRENTYVNGAILGMKKREIDRKFDAIVAFAEIDRFVDTPVKHYSSGMYMRLAFAVAAHLDAEILLVDEVLAVGDSAFQTKCLGKMTEIAGQGRTVLFISHNLAAIQRLCPRGLLFGRGRLIAAGSITDVVARYRSVERPVIATGRFNAQSRIGSGWAQIRDLSLVDESGQPVSARPADGDLVFDIEIALRDGETTPGGTLRGLVVELVICSEEGQPLLSIMNVDDGGGVELAAGSRCRVQARLAAPTFIPGRYRVNVLLGMPQLEHVDEIRDALELEVTPPERPWRPYEMHIAGGMVCRKASWSLTSMAQASSGARPDQQFRRVLQA